MSCLTYLLEGISYHEVCLSVCPSVTFVNGLRSRNRPSRVKYNKLAVLVFKSLWRQSRQTPQYTWRRNASQQPCMALSSAFVCIVPRTSTRVGDRSFCITGTRVETVCTALCDSMTCTMTVSTTIEDIFVSLRSQHLCDFFDAPCINSFTYLLSAPCDKEMFPVS